MAKIELSAAHARIVTAMYTSLNMPLDQLPYTPQFEMLYLDFIDKTGRFKLTRHDIWRWLANARKAKKLPPLRKVTR